MLFQLPPDRPAFMGILNVTPDSFSDGGQFFDVSAAIRHGLALFKDGADLVDVGGESTRPGSEPISVAEELRRVGPVISELAKTGVSVSIDTTKPEIASAAIDLGASVVNDISGFRNPEMRRVVAEANCQVCIMHMQGSPENMQKSPTYVDVVREVKEFLIGQAEILEQEGLSREKIWIDPGIGFGKNQVHSLKILQNIHKLAGTGYPVMVGVSRKSFLGRILNPDQPAPLDQRLEGTIAAEVLSVCQGARIIRTHDVARSRRAIQTATAILKA